MSTTETEYKIPEDIMELITDDFLNKFLDNLKDNFKRWLMNSQITEDELFYLEGTSGWSQALKTTSEKVFCYWNKLEWYDSDIFDSKITELMVSSMNSGLMGREKEL